MTNILIKNGLVIDPANKMNGIADILVEDTVISKVAKGLNAPAETVIDATDKIVLPGLIDMHVHLREPGREDKETISSGTKAALKGGLTSVLAMPNTYPAMDSAEQIKLLKNIIHKTAHTNVFMSGAITKGRLGQEVSDFAELKKEGIVAITDDGSSVDDEKIMLAAFKKAGELDLLVICHCEDQALSNQGVVNLGFISTQLGLRGISRESEYRRVQRDLELAAATGARIHIAHISCLESVELIAKARKKGAGVSAEVSPHHICLTEEAVLGYDTNMKMNPPLRSAADVRALKQALKEGLIDCIASDHAPHTENEKEIEFDRAEFGVIGLETELAVSITELIATGLLDWTGLVEKLALNPAKILKIKKGSLGVGSDADIVIVDPRKEWKVAKENFVSKSKNSCFLGRTLKGAVEYTVCRGKIGYKNGRSHL